MSGDLPGLDDDRLSELVVERLISLVPRNPQEVDEVRYQKYEENEFRVELTIQLSRCRVDVTVQVVDGPDQKECGVENGPLRGARVVQSSDAISVDAPDRDNSHTGRLPIRKSYEERVVKKRQGRHTDDVGREGHVRRSKGHPAEDQEQDVIDEKA